MDTLHCPLCGNSNQCSVAAGRDDEPCWCFTARIDPAALERLTPEQRDQACLCPRCAGVVAESGDTVD
ncbi:cysteine-rich CWC family protein [Pseudomonas sp. GD03944]|uniref:cysteine-rich CWC family protein n=1 Tax=Pseudomonas sp. GD03944 TaxID=2975409 RepID=UPI002446EB66|nr:cysteine-rich CWC family protein [Pseudomonas sp. GD03944]MDH1261964.1 cysteine-rich CWC family protein [Pseudomonas sp. GD03944]